ncbi:MAG: hypothetical protein AAGF59_02345 [Pseudomonadota bacterium]
MSLLLSGCLVYRDLASVTGPGVIEIEVRQVNDDADGIAESNTERSEWLEFKGPDGRWHQVPWSTSERVGDVRAVYTESQLDPSAPPILVQWMQEDVIREYQRRAPLVTQRKTPVFDEGNEGAGN